ncbi:hypothetical protein QA599_11610 [Haloarculaceae archaeon H-GB1-1]|nr:hypothetical protein [Haloarculaceae archaeon H-GB1-1]
MELDPGATETVTVGSRKAPVKVVEGTGEDRTRGVESVSLEMTVHVLNRGTLDVFTSFDAKGGKPE